MSGPIRRLLGLCDATPNCHVGRASYADSPPPEPSQPSSTDVLPLVRSDAPPTPTADRDEAGESPPGASPADPPSTSMRSRLPASPLAAKIVTPDASV